MNPLSSSAQSAGAAPGANPLGAIPPGSRLPELDGVRGLAIAMILLWHYIYLAWVPNSPGRASWLIRVALSPGWSGVDLFFVLSGFLIGGILLRERESANYYSVFYIRRVCRIFPLYFLVLAAFFGAHFWLSARPSFDWLAGRTFPAWSYATFTQNFWMAWRQSLGALWLAPTWSLAIEEQFYLLAPLAVRLLPPRRLPWILGFLALLAPVTRTALHFCAPGNVVAPFVLLPCRWDALLAGVLAAYACAHPGFRQGLAARSGPLVAAILLFGGAMFLFQLKFRMFSLPMDAGGGTLLALFYAALIVGVIHTPLGAPFRSRFLVWLGGISYCLYLIHEAVQGLLYGALRGGEPRIRSLADLQVTLLAFIISLVLAGLSGRFFERPFLQLGKRFRYRRDSHAPGLTSRRAGSTSVPQ